jgi:hypothetical protein
MEPGKDENLLPNIPICFITAQYSSSPKRTDILMDVAKTVPTLYHSSNFKFFAFTNLPNLVAPGWEIIVKDLDHYNRFITQSRWPKFQAIHEPIIQDNCDVVFYMDGVFDPIDSIRTFQLEAERILSSDVGLSQRKHPLRGGPPREFVRIYRAGKDIASNIIKSQEWLDAQPDYDKKCQMYENSHFGYSVHSGHFQEAADFFWDHYSKEEDSWRDQPLWCYVLSHFHIVPLDIEADKSNKLFSVDNSRYGMQGHRYTEKADSEGKAFRDGTLTLTEQDFQRIDPGRGRVEKSHASAKKNINLKAAMMHEEKMEAQPRMPTWTWWPF